MKQARVKRAGSGEDSVVLVIGEYLNPGDDRSWRTAEYVRVPAQQAREIARNILDFTGGQRRSLDS